MKFNFTRLLKKEYNIKKLKVYFSIIFSLLIAFQAFMAAYAVEDDEDEVNYGYEEDCEERIETNFQYGGVGIPTKYDPREKGIFTEINNQGQMGICWMYGMTATEEQNIVKNYGRKFSLSELHGVVALSDSIKKTRVTSNDTGFYKSGPVRGGTKAMALQYVTNWNSPIFDDDIYTWSANIKESDYPKSIFEGNSFAKLHNVINISQNESQFSYSEPLLRVTEAKYISTNKNDIKYAVQNYGAVQVDIYMNQKLLKIDENGDQAYNNASMLANHAVTIVGWDDDYPVDNFKDEVKPENNGAWLVKNSWGSNSQKTGYLWISYEEKSLTNPLTVTGVKRGSNQDIEYMLSYDYLPFKSGKSVNSTVYMTNVYDVSDYLDNYDEINQVMFYYKKKGDCIYNIRIVPLDNDNLPQQLSNYSELATGQLSGEGYLTKELSTPYILNNEYDKIAVVLEIVPTSISTKIYLPAENTDKNGTYKINDGESLYYIDSDGSNTIDWIDNKNNPEYNSGGNFCIRPILYNSSSNNHYANLSPTQTNNNGSDVFINIDSDSSLFSIHDSRNRVLYEDIDYIVDDDNITITSSYINAVRSRDTTLYLEFNNEIDRTLVINKNLTS